ncbi:unnamed protein product [Soboliphyme baturini]|uniref:pyridoxal 5'-phosphate synthase n=1 Tax=Soboliphyme baturini TaxID=241478 RepID=A0A183I9W1_9BILA|nr:unnamed protein product [Soboliphyme baturini]
MEEELRCVDPISLLNRWFEIALNLCQKGRSYFCLATANPDGTASSRMVVLVGNGPERSSVPFVSACFYWQPLQCQIITDESFRTVLKEETIRIFHKHTFDCQVTAAALEFQSSAITKRRQWSLPRSRLSITYCRPSRVMPCLAVITLLDTSSCRRRSSSFSAETIIRQIAPDFVSVRIDQPRDEHKHV